MSTSTSQSAGAPVPFDPLKFFNLSEKLAETSSEENLRTAVGRAYYALYLYAISRPSVQMAMLNHPKEATAHTKKMGVHEYALWILGRVLRRKSISSKLRELKELRVCADYQMQTEFHRSNWSQNWNSARSLAEWLKRQLDTL